MLSARRLLLGHRGTWCGLTSTLHVIHHRHHRFSVSGSFIYIFNLHHLEVKRENRIKNTPQALVLFRPNVRVMIHTYLCVCICCTCKYLVCVTTGAHCRLLVLQQPEQRCTSTQGGHNRKLALLRSSIALVISTTSVRTLHRACCAGWASEGRHD